MAQNAQHRGSHTRAHDSTMESHVSAKTYWIIFAVLMVLLVLTVGAAQVDLGPFNIPIALTIATVKAVVIVLYFMHVRFNSRLIWLFVCVGFFWLTIMLGFTLNDYFTRDWVPLRGR